MIVEPSPKVKLLNKDEDCKEENIHDFSVMFLEPLESITQFLEVDDRHATGLLVWTRIQMEDVY